MIIFGIGDNKEDFMCCNEYTCIRLIDERHGGFPTGGKCKNNKKDYKICWYTK